MLNMPKLFKHQKQVPSLELRWVKPKREANGRVTVEMETELKNKKMEAHWEAELQRDKARYELDFQKQKDTQDLEMQKVRKWIEPWQCLSKFKLRKQIESIKCTMPIKQDGRQNDLQMQMMAMAKKQVLTPEVMAEFLKQQTAQKAIDGDGTENRQTQAPTQMHQSCCNIPIQQDGQHAQVAVKCLKRGILLFSKP